MKTQIHISTNIMKTKLQLFATTVLIISSLYSSIGRAEIHTIDLLVLHPPKSILNTDIPTRVASMENYANTALENSNANIRFRVVKIEEFNLPNPKTDAVTLHALRGSKKAHELRAKYGADLVTMITPTGPYCGVGYVLGGYNNTIYSGHKNYGFNVVADRCISSFAHELGHNLGLGHSAKQGSKGGLYAWGRGHGEQNNFVTTMAYTSAYNASRLQVFSNPEITTCNGLKCGKSTHYDDGAHATKAVGVSGPQIASWFESREIVNSINLPPNAVEDYAITKTNETVEINVLANDVDPENDDITLTSVGTAKHGTTSFEDGVITYIPEQGFVGQDNFQYTIDDNHNHPTNTTVTVNVGWGVNFEYFQGQWNSLPDFTNLTAIKHGISHNFSLEKRERNNDFGFRYFAQIEVPKTGSYQFFLTSDDGSQLLIDNKLIIDNDGLHDALTKNTSVNLTAGSHRFEVLFFQAAGAQQLKVEWQGPGFERQIISSNALRLADPINSFPVATDDTARITENTEVIIDVLRNDVDTDGDEIQIISLSPVEHGKVSIKNNKLVYQPDSGFNGKDQFSYLISDGRGGEDYGLVTVTVGQAVDYEYYEGSWNSLPDFDSLTPIASGTQKDFALTNRNQNDNFAFHFRSGLDVPNDGHYYIFLISDDGSKIFIDGELLINNDGIHGRRFKYTRVELSAGIHEIEVQYFEKTGRERLALYWWERQMGFKKISEQQLKPF